MAIVFIVSVFGVTLLFGLILLVLKCLENRRASDTAVSDGQRPTREDHAVAASLMPDNQSQALLLRGNRWQERLAELLRQTGLLSDAANHQSEFDIAAA